jgi:hypothetical protein
VKLRTTLAREQRCGASLRVLLAVIGLDRMHQENTGTN